MNDDILPCEVCIHQVKAWYDDPCCRCGAEKDFPFCENEKGELIHVTVHYQEDNIS